MKKTIMGMVLLSSIVSANSGLYELETSVSKDEQRISIYQEKKIN
jgi:hypothetical protein